MDTYLNNAYGVPATEAGAVGGGAAGLGGADNVNPYSSFAGTMRSMFNRLTPEQAGTYSAGYSMGPSRWSVFG